MIFKIMRKHLNILLIAGLMLVAQAGYAQSIDGVVSGLRGGNAAAVMANAGNDICLTIADKKTVYSSAQGEQVLKDFFSKIGVRAFELKHKADAPSGRYAIGTLASGAGNYRVNIFMKNAGGKEIINELRFQLIE